MTTRLQGLEGMNQLMNLLKPHLLNNLFQNDNSATRSRRNEPLDELIKSTSIKQFILE